MSSSTDYKYNEKQSTNSSTMSSLTVYKVGLGVRCSPRDTRFAGSNPTEVDGFFQDVKILSTSSPEGTWEQNIRIDLKEIGINMRN